MTFATSNVRQHSSLAPGLRQDRIHRLPSPIPKDDPTDRQIHQPLPEAAPIRGARALLFGRFSLVLHRRELLADGLPVPIGNRALDVLIVLMEGRGQLVTKDELLSRVWPSTTVEENSLQFQISALRKALGNNRGFIKTVSGRGYRFVAEITISSTAIHVRDGAPDFDQGATAAAQLREPPSNLPAPTSDLVGREVHLSDVAGLVAENRLVTLVGAGGIGKTSLGVELARRLLPQFVDGAWVADVGPLSDPGLVPTAVATALGLASGPAPLQRLAAALASKRLLLVLDNCEHLIDAVASSVEALLHASASMRVIATSREPLRSEGEQVYRVPPLDMPPQSTETVEQLLQHSAAKLFIARAHAAEPDLPLDERIVAATVEICRHLDGKPLALELAAAHAAVFGVQELASRLDERFSLLTDGRRTAPPRHQTLRATLDWSFALLPEPERVVMQRLSIFGDAFTMEAASTVAMSDEIAASDITHHLASLVTKSLIVSDISGPVPRYRIRETTRVYAINKLTESGEFDTVARRLAVFQAAECAGRPIDGCRHIADSAKASNDERMFANHNQLTASR